MSGSDQDPKTNKPSTGTASPQPKQPSTAPHFTFLYGWTQSLEKTHASRLDEGDRVLHGIFNLTSHT